MANKPRPDHTKTGRYTDSLGEPGWSFWDTIASSGIPARSAVRGELGWLVLCGPAALVVLVLVARHGWPVWWLVIAGMLLAWAGDAAWDLVAAVVDTMVGRRIAGGGPPPPADPGGEHR